MVGAEGDGEQLRYVIRWVNDHTAIVLTLPARKAVARLKRTPGGHTTAIFEPGLSELQRAWLYGRLLDYLEALPGRCPDTLR
jgi:hypothetical protein